MKKRSPMHRVMILTSIFLLFAATSMESMAWARAGGGGSMGSRGSRSFSSPSMPSRPSPYTTPGGSGSDYNTSRPGGYSSPYSQPSGGFTRNPFFQGLAGGLAGGLLGNMLFGSRGEAAPVGGSGGGGIGLMDIVLIGAAIYFVMKYLKRRRQQQMADAGYPMDAGTYQPERPVSYRDAAPEASPGVGGVEKGFQQIRQFDPSFSEEELKETFQDLFFRIQAAWMHRSLDGIEELITGEMRDLFSTEFNRMKQQGRINRLENIAVRKVEPSEVWQEMGKDYVTVLFTANLLDYVVDEKTGAVLEGNQLSPTKFEEFWTFCRDVGTHQWFLAGINQAKQ